MADHPKPRTQHSRRLNEPGSFRRLRLLGATFALGMSLSASAGAQPAPWLDWSPPPECPSAADIERRVAEWLGGPFPTDADIAVRTALTWNGALWEVAVEISFGDQSGTRQVAVRDCQEAADFVAVAVALAVDPSLAAQTETQTPDAVESKPELDASREAKVEPVRPVEQASGSNAAKPSATLVRPSAAPDSALPFRPHVSVAAEGAAGVLPEPALGIDAAVGGDIGRLSLSLGARWLPPASTAPERAAAPIEFSLLGGRVDAAYLFFGPEARVGPSVAVDAGAIQAQQLRAGGDRVVEPWVSLAAGVLGLAALGAHVSVFGEVEVEVPLTRPTFVLSDESVVHRVGVGARAALGLRFSFFDQ